MAESPYLFPASRHGLVAVSPQLKVREGISPFGIAVRYQERRPPPDGDAASPPDWCETGHSVFVLEGRLRYTFDDHVVDAGPGDMLHIPAGAAHRHRPEAVGPGVVKYFLTEFV